jgi:hypothetical protein
MNMKAEKEKKNYFLLIKHYRPMSTPFNLSSLKSSKQLRKIKTKETNAKPA